MEFINLRVRAIGRIPSLSLPKEKEAPRPLSKAMKKKRPIYFTDKGFVEVPIYERDRLGSGTKIPGPCLIEETISTALIPEGYVARIDEFKNIVITEA